MTTPEQERIQEAERRAGTERRRAQRFPPGFSPFRRRKNSGRRGKDPASYVDIYDRRTWAIAFGVLGLSILDAILTMMHLRYDHLIEANPLMRMTIELGGTYTFFGVKTAMTALPLAVLILHKEWRVARIAAWICLSFYVLLMLYHIHIFSFHP